MVEALHQVCEDAFAMALGILSRGRTSVPKIASCVPISMALRATKQAAERALCLAVAFVDVAAAVALLAGVGRVDLDQLDAEALLQVFELGLQAPFAELCDQAVEAPAQARCPEVKKLGDDLGRPVDGDQPV